MNTLYHFTNNIKGIFSFFFIMCLHLTVVAQLDSYRSRIQALDNNGIVFYNTDGYVISSQILKRAYNEDNLKKAFKTYNIKKSDLKTTDDSLGFKNVYVSGNAAVSDSIKRFSSYYFVENPDNNIIAIQFDNIYQNRNLERLIVRDIIENKIPQEAFNNLKPNTINFAGRKIKLHNSCYWTNINTVQCPYMGEMNWSVHDNLTDAKEAVIAQELLTKSKKTGKIVVEENVDILFEGTQTSAKKIIYRFGAIMGTMTGAKELVIYYVMAKVRDNYVSCVLSHWNNDSINEDGLPPLLAEFMKLKK